MIHKNKITDAKLISGTELVNQTYLTSVDAVSGDIVFVRLLIRQIFCDCIQYH